MKIGQRLFKPAAWSILLTAAGVLLFVSLGLWQLERAAFKDAIQDKFESRLSQEYRRFDGAGDLEDIEYRKLILRGKYDNEHTFLVDNQIHRGRAGYHVVTPLELDDSDFIILVNRGWAEWGESRDPLPKIPPAETVGAVAGIANFPSEPALRLGGIRLSAGWPQLIPYIDIAALREQYSERLLPIVLWLGPEQPGLFVRNWNPVWMRPEKSRAYATQWFSFALVALIFFVLLNLRKIE